MNHAVEYYIHTCVIKVYKIMFACAVKNWMYASHLG